MTSQPSRMTVATARRMRSDLADDTQPKLAARLKAMEEAQGWRTSNES